MQTRLLQAHGPVPLRRVTYALSLHSASGRGGSCRKCVQAHASLSSTRTRALCRQHVLQLQQQRQPLQHTASAAALHTKSNAERTHNCRWVSKAHLGYGAEASLPAESNQKQRSYSPAVSAPEATARAAGVVFLASNVQGAEPLQSLPATHSSRADIGAAGAAAAMAALRNQLRPDELQDPSPAAAAPAAAAAADPIAATATAAAAAAAQRIQAQGLVSDTTQLTGFSARRCATAGSSWQYTCAVQAANMWYRKGCASAVEAACAYDLTRRALYGPDCTVNFPPSVYTDADTEAVKQHIETSSPGMLEAAAAAAEFRVIPNYQHAAARRALDALVAAAAQRAIASGYDVTTPSKLRGIRQFTQNSFAVDTAVKTAAGTVHLRWYHSSDLEAACAFDLRQLARGRSKKLNLSVEIYTSEDVATMQHWLQLELTRKLTAKGCPAAEAAAAMVALRNQLHPDELQDPSSAGAARAAAAAADRIAAMATAAAAAAAQRVQAQGLALDTTQLTGISARRCAMAGSSWQYTCVVQAAKMLYNDCASVVEAACADDLARRALYGPDCTVNFPPSVYTDADTEAVKQLIKARSPGMLEAAAAAAEFKVIPGYQHAAARRALDALVAAAAQRAIASGYDVTTPSKLRGIRQFTQNSFAVDTAVKTAAGTVRLQWYHSSDLEAACSFDLCQLARGSKKLNLPVETYTSDGVAAMQHWLQLQLTRKLTAKGSPAATNMAGAGQELLCDKLHDPELAGVQQAAAAAADRIAAAGLDQGNMTAALTGFQQLDRKLRPREFVVKLTKSRKYYFMCFSDRLQAACAYDLARCALRGPNFTVNFPPDVYTDAEATAFRQHLEHAAPSLIQAADAELCKRGSREAAPQYKKWYDYDQLLVVRAAEAAATAAAHAAAERGFIADPANRVSYSCQKKGFQVWLVLPVPFTQSQSRHRPGTEQLQLQQQIYLSLRCATAMSAACAADMMRVVAGRDSKLNFPKEMYQQAWLDAMGEYILLELESRQKHDER